MRKKITKDKQTKPPNIKVDQEWYETLTIEDTQIANKYIKICSISCYYIKKMQIKTMKYYYIPITMAKI